MDRIPTRPPLAEGLPLYQQLANSLITAIRDGQYPVGCLLPTENDLCERHGVSRHTVREALRQLSRLGLVSRRQGSGTQVESSLPDPTYSHSMRSLSELFQYAKETVLTLDRIEPVTPDDSLAFLLGGRPGRVWLRLEGTRRGQDGRPICRSLVFVHPDHVGIEPLIRSHRGPIYQLIEAHSGMTVNEVRQEITAEPMSAEIAAALGQPPGAWAIRVVRRYVGDLDKPVEISINYHPAHDFSYTMRLRRDEMPG
jgi:GntR family transcriptional regulator